MHPTNGTNYSKASTWNLKEPNWCGSLRIVGVGSYCVLKFGAEGNSYGESLVGKYPGDNLFPVKDSTRYFVVKITYNDGICGFAGIGFTDRADSNAFCKTLHAYFQRSSCKLHSAYEGLQGRLGKRKLSVSSDLELKTTSESGTTHQQTSCKARGSFDPPPKKYDNGSCKRNFSSYVRSSDLTSKSVVTNQPLIWDLEQRDEYVQSEFFQKERDSINRQVKNTSRNMHFTTKTIQNTIEIPTKDTMLMEQNRSVSAQYYQYGNSSLSSSSPFSVPKYSLVPNNCGQIISRPLDDGCYYGSQSQMRCYIKGYVTDEYSWPWLSESDCYYRSNSKTEFSAFDGIPFTKEPKNVGKTFADSTNSKFPENSGEFQRTNLIGNNSLFTTLHPNVDRECSSDILKCQSMSVPGSFMDKQVSRGQLQHCSGCNSYHVQYDCDHAEMSYGFV